MSYRNLCRTAVRALLLIGLTASSASAQTFTLFPAADQYGLYVADPERPTNTISFHFLSDPTIPDTRSPRSGLAAGGRFGMWRIQSSGGRSLQINIDAGLDAVFDMQNKEDSIGWDGLYGLSVTTTSRGPLAFKFGIAHASGHMGDEYAQRTGASRVNYTRQEVTLGVSARMSPTWRVYGEGGVAYADGSQGQKPYRAQTGIEYESRPHLMHNTFAWYGAGDFSSWEERDWRFDSSIHGGVVTRSNGRTYRLGVNFRDGRPPVTQFYRFTETAVTVGFWIDF